MTTGSKICYTFMSLAASGIEPGAFAWESSTLPTVTKYPKEYVFIFDIYSYVSRAFYVEL